jgi:hypothetical protein
VTARLVRAVVNSSLWRELSVRNPNHLLIVAGSGLAFVVAAASALGDGAERMEAIAVGVNVAVMVFLAWAAGRELDPDDSRSAFVAAVLASLVLIGGSGPAGAMVGILLALRIVTRSTGKAPSRLDLVLILPLAAAFAWLPRGWVGGAAMAAALVWDTRLPRPGGRRNLFGAAGALGVALAVAFLRDTFGAGFRTPSALDWAAVAGAAVALPAMRQYAPRATGDRSRARLAPDRLRAGRLLGLGSGLAAFVWFGGAAVGLLPGLWASLIGVAVYDRLIKPVKGRR